MTELTDSQALILSAAAQRDGKIALPLPPSLRGGAAKKVVRGVLANGYLAEAPASREPGTLAWDHDDQENPMTLIATAQGLSAIGVEPAEGQDAATKDASPGDGLAKAGNGAEPKERQGARGH